jgi:hypothetical protein
MFGPGMQSRPSSSTPSTSQYRPRLDHIGASTTVTVGVTIEPDSLIPDYFIKRAGRTIIDAANQGLRRRVLRGKASDQAE